MTSRQDFSHRDLAVARGQVGPTRRPTVTSVYLHVVVIPVDLALARIADRVLEGVTCIRLDATVVRAHSDKELAEANFKG